MNEVNIVLYDDKYKDDWDNFINMSKNGHFFFYRKYMEYHSDRFEDFSMLCFDKKGNIIAVIPASKDGDVLVSHGGLTFGGVISDENMSTEKMLVVFNELKSVCKVNGIRKILYKCIPYIYNRYPADEDRYALFINNATLIRRDVSTAIYLPCRYKYKKLRKRMINKARNKGVNVRESSEFIPFINLINGVLRKYHDTSAVHSGEELKMLASRFPDNIHLYIAELDGEMLAGTVVFVNNDVVHTQYLANSDSGRDVGALDLVIDYLITEKYTGCSYLDFGISNEQKGRYLNRGLIEQKEGFGARAVVHDFYELNI